MEVLLLQWRAAVDTFSFKRGPGVDSGQHKVA
jgi:hypothetical protein